ncbi:MAG: rod shape-determining protein MreD [Stellaceae bacterium]
MLQRTETVPKLPQSVPAAGRLLPVATTLCAVMLAVEPVNLPGYIALTPAFGLMTVYHWTLYRPDLLPPLALFGIGVAYDLLSGGPPGVTPLLFLLSRGAVLRCRRWFVDRTFPFIWVGFAVLTGGTMVGLWVLRSVLAFELVGLADLVFRAWLTISLFPIASFLLGRVQHALIGAG